MKVTPFFNRPDRVIDRRPLLSDVGGATERIILMGAYFTDMELAQLALRSKAAGVFFIFSADGLNRKGGERVYEVALERQKQQPGRIGVFILGNRDYREGGIMHHKLVAVDRQIAWCGSFNFTGRSLSNYELLLRIEDPAFNAACWQECLEIVERAGARPGPGSAIFAPAVTDPPNSQDPDERAAAIAFSKEVATADAQLDAVAAKRACFICRTCGEERPWGALADGNAGSGPPPLECLDCFIRSQEEDRFTCDVCGETVPWAQVGDQSSMWNECCHCTRLRRYEEQAPKPRGLPHQFFEAE